MSYEFLEQLFFLGGSADLTNPLRRQPPSAWVELLNRRYSLPLLRGGEKKDFLFQSAWEDKSKRLRFFEGGGKIRLLLLLYPVSVMHFFFQGEENKVSLKKK